MLLQLAVSEIEIKWREKTILIYVNGIFFNEWFSFNVWNIVVEKIF